MGSSTEGASPPEMMNWMHMDLQIEFEKRILVGNLKTPAWNAQGSVFRVLKTIVYQSRVDFHQLPLSTPFHWGVLGWCVVNIKYLLASL